MTTCRADTSHASAGGPSLKSDFRFGGTCCMIGVSRISMAKPRITARRCQR